MLPELSWRSGLVRLVSLLLAMGGCYWGVLLAAVCYRTDYPVLVALTLGPGYLITLAYLYRVFFTPRLPLRRSIWCASILVQGAWLAWIVSASLFENPPLRSLFSAAIPSLWWIAATLASTAAFLLEPDDMLA